MKKLEHNRWVFVRFKYVIKMHRNCDQGEKSRTFLLPLMTFHQNKKLQKKKNVKSDNENYCRK